MYLAEIFATFDRSISNIFYSLTFISLKLFTVEFFSMSSKITYTAILTTP